MRPWLLRATGPFLISIKLFNGLLAVTASKSCVLMPRRAGVVGLYALTGITSSPFLLYHLGKQKAATGRLPSRLHMLCEYRLAGQRHSEPASYKPAVDLAQYWQFSQKLHQPR